MNTSTSTSRSATVIGLVVGASGCAILWTAGAVPFAIPPGMIIMGAGALLVGWAPWRWVPAVGALLGLLFAGGAFMSLAGLSNLIHITGPTAALGLGIELIGALTALIAGLIATSRMYQVRADT